MTSRWCALLLALIVAALAPACGGHSGADPARQAPQPGLGNGDPAGVPAVPHGEPAGSVNKGTSSYKFVEADMFASSGATMTGSQLSMPAETGVRYAILGVNTGGQHPLSLTLNGTLSGLYVGVSDYTHGTWKWMDGVHNSFGSISLPATGTLSSGGSIYIALVCPGGSWATISVDLDIAQVADRWNLLVWIAGDNNLAQDAVRNLNDMESVGSTAKVNILVGYDIDKSQAPDVSGLDAVHFIKVVQDSHDNIIRTDGDLKNVSFLSNGYNSADPANLLVFINWAQTNFPATRNALVLWDHGDGWLPGSKGASSLRRWEANRSASGMLGDDRDGSLTSLTDNAYIAQTLSGKHFDLLCFDACNMAHIEALYDYRSLADWISASEALMPGLGYPYGAILSAWNGATMPSAEAVAKIIADETYDFYFGNEYVCQATVNTAALDALTTACAGLAAEVTPKKAAEAPIVQQAIASSLTPELSDGEADLGGFLAAYKDATTDPVIVSKIDTALAAYGAAVAYFRQYSPNHELDGSTGITAYLPTGSYFSKGYQEIYLPTAFNTATNWLGMLQAVVAPPVAWVPGDRIEISWANAAADMDLVLTDPAGHKGGPWDTSKLSYCMTFSPDNPNGGETTEWAKLKDGAPPGDYFIGAGFQYFYGTPPASYEVTVKLYDSEGALKQDLGVCTVPYYKLVDFAILRYTP